MKPLQLLLVSHALSSFSDRLWDFAFPVICALVNPHNALFLAALYSLSGQSATFLLSARLGAVLDAAHVSLGFVTVALLLQNASTVALSAALMLLSSGAAQYQWSDWLLAAIVVLFSVVSSLSSAAAKISVTLEWAPALQRPIEAECVSFNAHLRQAYLLTKIGAPLLAGAVISSSRSATLALAIVCGWNVCSCVVEIALLECVYSDTIKELHSGAPKAAQQQPQQPQCTSMSVIMAIYVQHPMALCSLAYCFLHCTILCPGSLLHVHLMTRYGVREGALALFQAACSLLGVAGTFMVTHVTQRLPQPAAAHAFLLFQVAVLWLGCAALWLCGWSTVFLALVALSRVGLWGFDVAHVSLMQSGLRDTAQRGMLNAFQYGLCDAFSVAIALPALLWSESGDFFILMGISLACVTSALLSFRAWLFSCGGKEE